MTASAILTGPQLHLPRERQGDDFETFAGSVLNDFLSAISGMAEQDELDASIKEELPKMTLLCTSLKDVLRIYLAGNTYAAYQRFVDSLPPILGDLQKLEYGGDPKARPLVTYRMRTHAMHPLRRQDIFHLPFELRHKATTGRYSLPGVPMLYLGGTVYICWEEMGRPLVDDIVVSAFWTPAGVNPRILNFGFRPAYVGGVVQDKHVVPAFVTSYCVCWPLMALCSIKAKRRDEPFVPEYVLPQMLLQWLIATKGTGGFDGIRYFSCHVDHHSGKPQHPMCSFVFPPKQYPATGLCPVLQAMFDWTSPLPWQEIAARPPPIDSECYRRFQFAPYPGTTEDYGSTAFGEVEARLNQLALDNDPTILPRAR